MHHHALFIGLWGLCGSHSSTSQGGPNRQFYGKEAEVVSDKRAETRSWESDHQSDIDAGSVGGGSDNPIYDASFGLPNWVGLPQEPRFQVLQYSTTWLRLSNTRIRLAFVISNSAR